MGTVILPPEPLKVRNSEIYKVLEDYSASSGVQITTSAAELVRHVLQSITEDPHPGWRASKEELEKISRDFLSDLPNLLNKLIRTDRNNSNIVTTFSILHFLGPNLDRICPIQK